MFPSTDLTRTLQPTFTRGDVVTLLVEGDVDLVDVAHKEALLRAGRSYGTLLTPEHAPSPLQQQTYERTLLRHGPRLGALLAGLSRTVLTTHPEAVYVSLARAGTPVGCALRRVAADAGRDVPHYTVSIIRGEGLDPEALRRIRAFHPRATLVFVDGWSGKGAIAATLRASVPADVPWVLALLCDPAGVATHAATWDDLLLPHAALNATVSGLLSRTFVQARGQLHGARLERDLAAHDVSAAYVDALVALARTHDPAPPAEAHMRPITAAAHVQDLAATFGELDPTRIKPGIGEATRVFLRRTPARLLLREQDHPDTAMLRELADGQGVPVSVHPALPYAAAALIASGRAP